MTESTVLMLTAAVALVLFVIIWKLVKAVVKAIVVALLVAGLLYWGLPRLEAQSGPAAEAVGQIKDALKKKVSGASTGTEGKDSPSRVE